MKAIVYKEYGSPDVLELQDVDRPEPKNREVLIKVHAAAANAADWRLMRADPFFVRFTAGMRKPKNPILGSDVAGRVEGVGPNVSQFQVGDAVFGDLSGSGCGGFAEYVCAPENLLAAKPANLGFADTAALPMASITALQGLRDVGQIKAGQKVLIHGASGGVGTFAVQIAKSYGTEVTAVCSTTKTDMARSLGADHVIDYTQEDFTRNGQQYDLIFAANGSRSLSDYARALTATGTFVVAGGSMSQLFQTMLIGPLKSKSNGKSFRSFTADPNQADLACMARLIEDGNVTPVIDRCYPLNETPDAMRYLEEGHANGKIVIMVVDTVVDTVVDNDENA